MTWSSPKTFQFYATCPLGCAEVLKNEFSNFPVEIQSVDKMGLTFRARFEDFFKVLLNTRIASKIWWVLHQEAIKVEKDLYAVAAKIPWKDFFSTEETFKVHTILGKSESRQKSGFHNSLYLSQLTKDAIVDHFQKHFKRRPSVNTQFPMVEVGLHLRPMEEDSDSEMATILLDLCGVPLNQRGYRSTRFLAPLRENLAAAIIDLMDINFEEDTFMDSMCGSGVMLLEALIKKYQIPPSFLQVKRMVKQGILIYSFAHLKPFTRDKKVQELWSDYLLSMDEEIDAKLKNLQSIREVSIFGSDINPNSLNEAEEALNRAGLLHLVSLKRMDALKLHPAGQKGVIFCNPPYGERLMANEQQLLEELYHLYGENLKKNFLNFKAFILTGNLEMRKKISLRTHQRIEIYNGPIVCRLLEYRIHS